MTLAILAFMLVFGIALNLNNGSVTIGARRVLTMLAEAARLYLWKTFAGGAAAAELDPLLSGSTEARILFGIRLPRTLLAAVLGGALSVSGYLLQVFFRNPIAGPFVLGISSGAKLAVGVTMIFLAGSIGAFTPATLILAAFLGALLITALVLVFSQKVKSMPMLLVVGIMIGYICSAVTDFCITFANDHDVVNLTNWTMGSFSGADMADVKTACIVCIPGVLLAMLLSKPIGAYAMGEGYAKSVGMRIGLLRSALIVVSSLLSACVTALAGPISFVGIAVPHIAKTMLKTAKPALVIPTTFLCGAAFCLFCDLLARLMFAPTELNVGTVTSVFGAPIVISVMIRQRRAREA
jgi:iron complex transport system permease protein